MVNAGLTILYWRVGKRINEEILKGERADYGKEILATVSQELVNDYGKGFSYSALTRMLKFSEVFPDPQIVATLSQTLSWSHFCELFPLEKPLQRDFYAEMCRIERWSVRTLRQKIGSMLYERTALSKKPEELARIELLELGKSGIHVAEYLTALPPRELLAEKLRRSIELARASLEGREKNDNEKIGKRLGAPHWVAAASGKADSRRMW